MKAQVKKRKDNLDREEKSDWAREIKKLQKDIIKTMKEKGIPKKSKEEIIEECRRIREQVWKEEFEYRYPD